MRSSNVNVFNELMCNILAYIYIKINLLTNGTYVGGSRSQRRATAPLAPGLPTIYIGTTILHDLGFRRVARQRTLAIAKAKVKVAGQCRNKTKPFSSLRLKSWTNKGSA